MSVHFTKGEISKKSLPLKHNELFYLKLLKINEVTMRVSINGDREILLRKSPSIKDVNIGETIKLRFIRYSNAQGDFARFDKI